MFKILVLQVLYYLSNVQAEYQICDRLSYMRFLGFDLHQVISDAKKIWLFRGSLGHTWAVKTLFAQLEKYLTEHGFHPLGVRSSMSERERYPIFP